MTNQPLRRSAWLTVPVVICPVAARYTSFTRTAPAKLFDWLDVITADCPRKQANNLNDIYGARCPDLSKVV